MKIYFSTNNIYYSKLFRRLFEEPTSHVAVGFFIDGEERVVDCTKPVGKEYSLDDWDDHYNVVHTMTLDNTAEEELDWYDKVCDYAVGKPYDFAAYYWGMLWGIIHKITKLPLPTTNMFEKPEHGLCTELFEVLRGDFFKYGIDIRDVELSAVTPHMLCMHIYNQTRDNPKVRCNITITS